MFKRITYCLLFILFLSNIHAQECTIKKRILLKATISPYSTIYGRLPWFERVGENKVVRRKKPNFSIEGKYGVSDCLEIGAYIGMMNYATPKTPPIPQDTSIKVIFFNNNNKLKQFLAPTFGLNINFHILPFFTNIEKCRWDLYLYAKYGGCLLIKTGIPSSTAPHRYLNNIQPYRHEYGVGLGASVYFWNLVGLNTELSVGQFSYWPDQFWAIFNFRAGVAFKLNNQIKSLSTD